MSKNSFVYFGFAMHFGGSNLSTLLLIREMRKHANIIVLDAYGCCRQHLQFMENYDIPYEALSNRIFLRRLMEKHGFIQSTTEWWHFFDEDWKSFPVRDIHFADLE